MAQRSSQIKIDTPTARRRLEARHGVYWNLLAKGCSLGYRRSVADKPQPDSRHSIDCFLHKGEPVSSMLAMVRDLVSRKNA